jgi:hypothetical protein
MMSYNQRYFLNLVCLLIVIFNVECSLASSAYTHIPTISSISFIGLFTRALKAPKHSKHPKHSNSKQQENFRPLPSNFPTKRSTRPSGLYPNTPISSFPVNPRFLGLYPDIPTNFQQQENFRPFPSDFPTKWPTRSSGLYPNTPISSFPVNPRFSGLYPDIPTNFQQQENFRPFPSDFPTKWPTRPSGLYPNIPISSFPVNPRFSGLYPARIGSSYIPSPQARDTTITWYRYPDTPRNESLRKELAKTLEFSDPTTTERPTCSPEIEAEIRNDYLKLSEKKPRCHIAVEAIKLKHNEIEYVCRQLKCTYIE